MKFISEELPTVPPDDFETSTPASSGRRSTSELKRQVKQCPRVDSNHQHLACRASTLTVELQRHYKLFCAARFAIPRRPIFHYGYSDQSTRDTAQNSGESVRIRTSDVQVNSLPHNQLCFPGITYSFFLYFSYNSKTTSDKGLWNTLSFSKAPPYLSVI